MPVRSPFMIKEGGLESDLAALVVPQSGRLVATGDRYEPYQLIDPGGVVVGPVTAYFRDLLAAGRAELTVRSYGFDLVRWFRFCWAAGVGWDRATRIPCAPFRAGRGDGAGQMTAARTACLGSPLLVPRRRE